MPAQLNCSDVLSLTLALRSATLQTHVPINAIDKVLPCLYADSQF